MAGGSRIPELTNAAVDALVADSTLTTALGGTKVYAHVPEDTAPPYLLVLGGREVPWAESMGSAIDDAGRECDVEVQAWSAYRGTKEVDDLIDRALVVLLANTPWTGVSGYSFVRLRENRRPEQQQVTGRVWYQRLAMVTVVTV